MFCRREERLSVHGMFEDPISYEETHFSEGVYLDGQWYAHNSMAEMFDALPFWKTPRVPMTRRPMTRQEIEHIRYHSTVPPRAAAFDREDIEPCDFMEYVEHFSHQAESVTALVEREQREREVRAAQELADQGAPMVLEVGVSPLFVRRNLKRGAKMYRIRQFKQGAGTMFNEVCVYRCDQWQRESMTPMLNPWPYIQPLSSQWLEHIVTTTMCTIDMCLDFTPPLVGGHWQRIWHKQRRGGEPRDLFSRRDVIGLRRALKNHVPLEILPTIPYLYSL